MARKYDNILYHNAAISLKFKKKMGKKQAEISDNY